MAEDTKKCPMCGEEILVIAKKCKHCGEILEDNKTSSLIGDLEELREKNKKRYSGSNEKLKKYLLWRVVPTIVGAFVLLIISNLIFGESVTPKIFSTIGVIAFLLGVVLFLVSLINPSWVKVEGRMQGFISFVGGGLGVCFLFIILSATISGKLGADGAKLYTCEIHEIKSCKKKDFGMTDCLFTNKSRVAVNTIKFKVWHYDSVGILTKNAPLLTTSSVPPNQTAHIELFTPENTKETVICSIDPKTHPARDVWRVIK